MRAAASADSYLAVRDRLLTERVEQHHRKLLHLARRVVADLTPDDLHNPQDFLQLNRDPVFNDEDGILAGLRSAHVAVREGAVTPPGRRSTCSAITSPASG